MNDYSKFLKEVEGMNEKYASIYVNCELEPLVMPFWSWDEIKNGLSLRREWEVDASLIPFYGDWHDLFCLRESTGEIIALDDNRDELCKWSSIKGFISSLSVREVEYDDKPQIVGALHSPDFSGKSGEFKKKH